MLPLYEEEERPTRPTVSQINSDVSYMDEIWIEQGEGLIVVRRPPRSTCLHLMLGCLLVFVGVWLMGFGIVIGVSGIEEWEMEKTAMANLTAVPTGDASVSLVKRYGDSCANSNFPERCYYCRTGEAPASWGDNAHIFEHTICWLLGEDGPPDHKDVRSISYPPNPEFPSDIEDSATAPVKSQEKLHYSRESEKNVQTIPCNPLSGECPFNDEYIGTTPLHSQEKRQASGDEDCSIMFHDSVDGGCDEPRQLKSSEGEVKRSLPDVRPRAAKHGNWFTRLFHHDGDNQSDYGPLSNHF